jgi:peptide/nickel transport system substrate-binding protein
MRRHVLSVSMPALVVLVLLLAVCGPAASSTGGTVTIRLGTAGFDFTTLDPPKMVSTADYQMSVALYDRLVTRDKDGKIVGQLASSWDLKPDSITAVIKKGATCSDGTPVTPKVVADSLRRMGAAETKSARAYRTIGKAGYTVTSDAAANSVTIKVNAPFSDLLLGLTMPWAGIVCPKGLANPDSLVSQASGSGPYVLTQVLKGDTYTLKLRPEYNWGPGGVTGKTAGLPQTILFKVVGNETTAANLLLSGGLDIGGVGGRDTERLSADKTLKKLEVPGIGSNGLTFNETVGRPGANKTIRQALSLAIEAAAWNQAETFGTGMVMKTLYTPNMACYKETNGQYTPGYDPEQAKKLLKGVGYVAGPDGLLRKDGQTLKIKIAGYEGQNAGNEYLLDAYKKIGVDASASVTDFSAWLDVVYGKGAHDWDVHVEPWGSVMPSPSIFFGQVTGKVPPEGGNPSNIQNADYEKYGQAAYGDPATACENWQKAEVAILQNFDIKPTNVAVFQYFSKKFDYFMFGPSVVDVLSIRALE